MRLIRYKFNLAQEMCFDGFIEDGSSLVVIILVILSLDTPGSIIPKMILPMVCQAGQ